jgi:hypothetical protein
MRSSIREARHDFSKVSALVHFKCKVTIGSTFENARLAAATHAQTLPKAWGPAAPAHLAARLYARVIAACRLDAPAHHRRTQPR